MSYEHLTRCMQLSDTEIAQSIETRESAKRLLERLSAISKPSDGAPKLLMVFARMATTACDWLDGELRIEIVGDTDACVVEMMSDLGGGLRERVFPAFVMNAPLFEFTRAVERVPHVIAPLTTRVKTERRIVFVASQEIRMTSMPPPHIEIDDESLFVPRAGGMPQVSETESGNWNLADEMPTGPKR
jgi:hypothetical protein